jgi:hypothetical protein
MYMHVLEIIWEIFFCFFFPLIFNFFCVKRPDDGSGRPGGKIDSSRCLFSLPGLACFYDLLRGTTSERHLSSVWTVNPVGLYRIPPHAAAFSFRFLCPFCHLVRFFCAFHAYFSRARVIFAIYLHPRYIFILFY